MENYVLKNSVPTASSMQQTNVPENATSAAAADYSNFFHSGLRAISSHVRSISTPLIIDSKQTSHTPSLRSTIRSRFWKRWGNPSSETDACPTKETPAAAESTPAFGNIWTIKGVPLRLALPRFPSFDGSVSPSNLVSLDPLAPSPTSTSSSFFDDLSETTSRDSLSSNVELRKGDSFHPISSASLPHLSPLSGRPLSIQTMPLPSCRSFIFSSIDQKEKDDDLWIRGLDLESPLEFLYGRLDVLPQSAVDAEVSWDGEDFDWRQFHSEWVRADAEPSFSPTRTDIS